MIFDIHSITGEHIRTDLRILRTIMLFPLIFGDILLIIGYFMVHLDLKIYTFIL